MAGAAAAYGTRGGTPGARGSKEHGLLVVDGYNVLFATPRYQGLVDKDEGSPGASYASRLGNDPFVRAREALAADVATYAQGRYEAVIVYDGARNLSPDRNNIASGGVGQIFSRQGESADAVIERLVTEAREAGREVALVTSDATIRAASGGPLTRISSAALVHEMEVDDESVAQALQDRTHVPLTLADRLPADQREKLDRLLGRA